MDGGRGNASKRVIISGTEVARVKGHHVSGPNDDEFDALPEGEILGQPDGLRVPLLNVPVLVMVMGVVFCVYAQIQHCS